MTLELAAVILYLNYGCCESATDVEYPAWAIHFLGDTSPDDWEPAEESYISARRILDEAEAMVGPEYMKRVFNVG